MRSQAEAREQPRARSTERRSGAGRPFEEGFRRGIAGDLSFDQRDRPVGGRQAALQAMLRDQNRRIRVLVQPPQEADQLVAGDRIELRGRLVEHDQRGPARERGSERHSLQLASRKRSGRAIEQVRDPQRQRSLLDPAGNRRGRLAAILERKRQLGADGPHHNLRLGVLEQRPDHYREVAGPVLARIDSRDDRPTGERAAMEVGHEPVDGAQ